MLTRTIAISAALGLAATPAAAAELHDETAQGARRSGASVAAYLRVELDRRNAVRPVAGLRLAAVHDYRNAAAPTARVLRADALDLRLAGPAPALYLAGRPVTGRKALSLNAGEGGSDRLDTVLLAGGAILVIGAAVVIGTSF